MMGCECKAEQHALMCPERGKRPLTDAERVELEELLGAVNKARDEVDRLLGGVQAQEDR